ncbi:MAG TPA: DUF2784 domain-containing protein [Geobacteraceae bacterium]|nr:DUF2784 domain-containing protein [Geobacteraceae bacterium]
MIYPLLADLVVLVHVAFVLFVVCGGLAVLRWRRLAWLHLPATGWGVAIEIKGWVCPLTYLENGLRRMGGEAGYGGSCIEHYLEPILYPIGLTPGWQVLMGIGVLVLNIVIYCFLWWRSSRSQR